jgi:uncharacterized protein involved in response to NO
MPNLLPLVGETPASSARPMLALFAKGFRPFFLLAGVFSVVAVPLWLIAQIGGFQPDPYLNPTY